MPDMNPYMAQFADVPALVAPRCQEQVNSNLQALSSIGAEMLTASTSEPKRHVLDELQGIAALQREQRNPSSARDGCAA
jgi:hypothetical protein